MSGIRARVPMRARVCLSRQLTSTRNALRASRIIGDGPGIQFRSKGLSCRLGPSQVALGAILCGRQQERRGCRPDITRHSFFFEGEDRSIG